MVRSTLLETSRRLQDQRPALVFRSRVPYTRPFSSTSLEMEDDAMDAEQKFQAALAEFPVVVIQPVQWGEQDALGHVNHVTYFRWYESARIAYFLKIGLMDMHKHERIGPILASVTNDYRRQINYPDTVHIGVRITRIGRSSLGMEHKIYSQNDRALAAEGTSTLVVFDYQTNTSHAVPARIRHAIESLEGRSFES